MSEFYAIIIIFLIGRDIFTVADNRMKVYIKVWCKRMPISTKKISSDGGGEWDGFAAKVVIGQTIVR